MTEGWYEIAEDAEIIITHNPIRQLCTRHYKCSNGELAEELLNKFTAAKVEKGYKLRHVWDKDRCILELSDRKPLNVAMAERLLTDSGIKIERTRWTNLFQKKLEDFAWR